jgi:hypothetical protein
MWSATIKQKLPEYYYNLFNFIPNVLIPLYYWPVLAHELFRTRTRYKQVCHAVRTKLLVILQRWGWIRSGRKKGWKVQPTENRKLFFNEERVQRLTKVKLGFTVFKKGRKLRISSHRVIEYLKTRPTGMENWSGMRGSHLWQFEILCKLIQIYPFRNTGN